MIKDFPNPPATHTHTHTHTLTCTHQHPAHRLKLTQILDHPFMEEQPVMQPTVSNEAPLLHNHLMRNIQPVSLASLDSGHATQYTQSTTSSHTVNSRGGPIKATMRPRGIAGHIPSTVCPVSSNSSSRNAHSRHQSLTHQDSCRRQLSEMDSHQPYQGGSNGGMPYRRSQSVETLHTREVDECENLSCHSNPCSKTAAHTASVLTARNVSTGMEGSKKHSSSCGELRSGMNCNNKENDFASVKSSMRKANSELGDVYGLQRQQLGSSSDAPFRDRTNRSKVDDGRQKSSGFTTTAVDKPKIRTLNELVPPLNGARLRPIQQQTRSAHVSAKCRIEAI